VPDLSLDVGRAICGSCPGRRLAQADTELERMTTIGKFIVTMCMAGLSAVAFAQSAATPRITAAEAKNHADETVTVCGKVVDTKIFKYALGGHGKPVNFDLDQPEPNPIFFFTTFGTEAGGPDEAVNAYKGKDVCVTGKVSTSSTAPFIMAADRSKIKVQPEKK